jgi:hypothetical protein
VVGVRAVDEDVDVFTVGFWLGERVVEDDVDIVEDRLVRVELSDHDSVAIGVQQVGQPDDDHVVVVDKRHAHRSSAAAPHGCDGIHP